MKIHKKIYHKWNKEYEEIILYVYYDPIQRKFKRFIARILLKIFKVYLSNWITSNEIGMTIVRYKHNGDWVYSYPSVYAGLIKRDANEISSPEAYFKDL